MKPLIKTLAALGIGALSLAITTQSDAQIRIYGPRPRVSIGLGLGFYPGVSYYYNPYGGYYGYTYPRIGFSIGYLPYGYLPFYWGPNLYYYSNGIYYQQYQDNSYHVVAPPVGAEVPKLPSHVHAIAIDNQQYFEQNGVYYKPNMRQDGTHDYIIAGKDGVLNTNVVAGQPVMPQGTVQPQQGNIQPQPNQQPPVNDAPVNSVPQSGPQVNQVPPANDDQPLPPPPTDAPAPKTGDIVNQLPDGCKSVTVAGKKYFVSPVDVYYEEFNNSGKVGYKVAGTPNDGN